MKKFLVLMACIAVLVGAGRLASADSYFQDGHLIRVVYDINGQSEVDTDMGAFSPASPYSGSTMTLTTNLFPPAGSGVFASATWAKMQVAYFIKDSTHMLVWTSGPAAGQKNGNRHFGQFEGAANGVFAGAIVAANGTAQATQSQSSEQSYVTLMDNGNPVDSAGYFSGFLPDQDGEQNLGSLGSGAPYVDSYLYYYATPDNSSSGVQVADIRTFADGHTEIHAVGGSTPPPAAATHFSVSAPSSATAGTAFNVTVTALDASNNTVTGYSGKVHFTSSDTAAVLPADAMLTNGTGSFQFTLKTNGNQTVTATDTVTSSITGTSGQIAVSSAVADIHFVVSAIKAGQPVSSIKAGKTFKLTVTAVNSAGKLVASYNGAVHFTSTDSSATLPSDTALINGASGKLSAVLGTAGIQAITATDTTTSSITGSTGNITVKPAAATHLTVSAPPTVTTGTKFQFTVTALDQFNNVATACSDTVHFKSSDPKAKLPADSALVGGTGTFNAKLKTAGSQKIKAVDIVSATVQKGTSDTITVN